MTAQTGVNPRALSVVRKLRKRPKRSAFVPAIKTTATAVSCGRNNQRESMAKEKQHFKFHVGDLAVCVEGGGGYGASEGLYDTVGVCVRKVTDKKVGAREAVTHFVHRGEIAAIGLSFLDVARQMAPETAWARSETVFQGRSQQRPVIPMSMQERETIDAFVNETGINLLRDPVASFDKLRRRIHTLQKAQFLLERVDDGTAQQLDLFLTLVEQTGSLPFQIGVGIAPNQSEDGSAKNTTH